MSKRVSLGIGNMGGAGENSSCDIFLAFSTANPSAGTSKSIVQVSMLPNDQINPIFHAAIDATEEAIMNAMIAARDMIGRDDNKVYALPHNRLKEVMKKYNRLVEIGKK